MTLKVVQDTSTNWTNAEWRIIDRMKKNYAEMDERSGRPWTLGDDLLALYKAEPEIDQRVLAKDAAHVVGMAVHTHARSGYVSAAGRVAAPAAGVSHSVFRALASAPDRVKILKRLIAEYGAEGITYREALRAVGKETSWPRGLKEYVANWSNQLDRFMEQRLYSADRLALEQLRLKIDILLGDADEEAV
jgi:hypothetical protein